MAVSAMLAGLVAGVRSASASDVAIHVLKGPEPGAVVAGEAELVLWATSSEPLSEVTLTVRGARANVLRWTYDPEKRVVSDIVAATIAASSAGSYEIVATARAARSTATTTRAIMLAPSRGDHIVTAEPRVTVRKIDPPPSGTVAGSSTTSSLAATPPTVDAPTTTPLGTGAPPDAAPPGGSPATTSASSGPSGAGPPTSTAPAGVRTDPVSERDGSGGLGPALFGAGLGLLFLTGAVAAVFMRKGR